MKAIRILSTILVFTLFLSCNSAQNRNSTGTLKGKPLEKGKVLSGIVCLKDPSITYDIYLPKNYSEEKRYPLILAFDPHASGILPVNNYKDLAERFGYILIGSNNSKNGLPMQETENIVFSMFEEINARFAVDTSRIYLMGFSGGSRIASLVALFRGGIRGVIGCGAGFPGTDQPGRYRFDYIGLAGNADFNMNELVSLSEQLDKTRFRHSLIIFDGKHEWPSAPVMERAFYWTEFCAMKDKLIPVNNGLISEFTTRTDAEIQKDYMDGMLIYKRSLDVKRAIQFLEGLQFIDDYKKMLEQTTSSEDYKKAAKHLSELKEKEMKDQQFFTENFYNKDLAWWEKRITNYELGITSGKDHEEVLMYKRVMSYLSLLAYMKYTGASSSGDKEKADFAMEVYKIVDPENAAKIK